MNMVLPRQSTKQLANLNLDNRFTEKLPGDPETENSRRQVTGACYSKVAPTRVSSPKLVSFSPETARLINLSDESCRSDQFRSVFAGNELLPQMAPFSMCYGGHQFGSWAGQLGDGRAINLGEVVNQVGERWVLQLKGAGPTPYSRTADGLAVLRSSVREYLCSEAMFHLGIPTTRALSLIMTGEQVLRDMFYDGHPKNEPGAVVCRVSPSFIRFGNFEILTSRGDLNLLRQLADYTIRTDFPHLGEPAEAVYLSWFREICQSTAEMIVHWMRVGFVHGVMNTDNMSILGLTIDYGPYGWLEGFETSWTPNTTDAHGRRYAYSNQPHIGQWNLLQLANAIYPLVNKVEPFEEILSTYNTSFQNGWNEMMAGKLGFSSFSERTDDATIKELIEILQLTETDMTIFFRNLATISPDLTVTEESILPVELQEAYYKPDELTEDYSKRINSWLQSYTLRLREDAFSNEKRLEKMNGLNPQYVLRNYLAQVAIDKAEQGDFTEVDALLDLLRNPYTAQPGKERYAEKRPEWARNRAGCSMLSCSS